MIKENYLKTELYDLINNNPVIFEFIQSGSLDGIWYWDLVSPENEWMSPKFWEVLGYKPDEMKHLASEWQDIIFQDDLKLANENFVKHCADPSHPYDQVVRYKHKNGSTVWIRCRGLAIRDEYGNAIRMLGAHTDITELKQAEVELSRLANEYEKVFNGTQDTIFLLKVLNDGSFRFIRNNLAYQRETGISLEQIMNKSPQELLGKELGDVVAKNFEKCVLSKTSISYEEDIYLPEGNRVWLTTLNPILEEGKVTHIVGSSSDITERKKLELELKKQANYDLLTGLPNRKLFFERLERIIIESERDERRFALLFIDLDKFKDINDTYGHEVGDEVLITVGNRLSNSIRKSDTAARMGGDEFTIILRNIEDIVNLDNPINKIHTLLKDDIHIGDIKCNVGSSIGVAIYPEHGKDAETLLRNADSSMYEMKSSGRNGFTYYQENNKL